MNIQNFRNNKGVSLIEIMIVTSLMGVVALGVGSLIQQLTRSNLNTEQKQESIQLYDEVEHLLANRDTCTLNFGSPPATHLGQLPKNVDELVKNDGVGAPFNVFEEYDGTSNTVYRNGQIRITQMILEGFTPDFDVANNPTNTGTAWFRFSMQKNRKSEGADDFRTRSIKLAITLNQPYSLPLNQNIITGCVAVDGDGDTIWIKKPDGDIYYNSGRVAIGTDDPTPALTAFTVVQGGNSDPIANFLGVNATDSVLVSVGNPGNLFSLGVPGAAAAITPGTAVGDGVLRIGANKAFHFSNGGTRTDLTVGATGNVGIGNTAPANKLDVVGNAGITGNTSISGSANITGGASVGGNFNVSTTLSVVPGAPGTVTILGNIIGPVNVNGDVNAVNFFASSDENLKKNIKDLSPQLKSILEVPVFSFQYKTQDPKDTKRHFGVIAQKLQKVYPDLVSQMPDGTLSVNYTEMIPLLIKSVQEMQIKINSLEQKIEKLERPKAKR